MVAGPARESGVAWKRGIRCIGCESFEMPDWTKKNFDDLRDVSPQDAPYLLAQGGARFARSLVETGLIDEYRLVVHPVVLGAGEQLFTAPLTIEPMGTTVFSSGAVAHVFAAHP